MIVLADANILMDLGYVQALPLLPQLAACEVLNSVLMECEDARQEDLLEQISTLGFITVEVDKKLVEAAAKHAAKALSLQDKQCLIYCQQRGRILLTGDKLLRREAKRSGVAVHGTIWLLEQAWQRKLYSPTELCRWLHEWQKIKRRLPAKEIERLKKVLACSERVRPQSR